MSGIFSDLNELKKAFLRDVRNDFGEIDIINELKVELATRKISDNVADRYIKSKELNKPETNELYSGNNALLYALLNRGSYGFHHAGYTQVSKKYGLRLKDYIIGIGEEGFLDSATPGHNGVAYWRIQEYGSEGGYIIKPRGTGYKLKFKVVDQTTGRVVDVETDSVVHPGVPQHAFYLERGGAIYADDIETLLTVMGSNLF